METYRTAHIVVCGERAFDAGRHAALVYHMPAFEADARKKTRITVLAGSRSEIEDFVFEYQELFDNSWWRVIDLSAGGPPPETHRPQYDGRRSEFVDVEWEFVVARLSNPVVQAKLRRWSTDAGQSLVVRLAYEDAGTGERYASCLRRRLPGSRIEVYAPADESVLLRTARYLNYFYEYSRKRGEVPVEMPEDEVERAWQALTDPVMRRSNIYNAMSIPAKMELLGHDPADWRNYYALTAKEIELLTAVEHNRWCVERLMQGTRPCTDREAAEVEADMRRRLADSGYAARNPVSLKKKFKNERGAHYDLRPFCELGVDESGLPVSRYDRDLTRAIPLIARACAGKEQE